MSRKLEICVDTILSAKNAAEGGADRIELCSALSEGGLTPSVGLLKGVQQVLYNSNTKIYCMIRIRRGDFDFSNDELDAMIEDVKYFKLKNVDGIVIGCLNSESEINVEFCEKLISAWGDRNSVTFHRAFDETKVEDFKKNLKVISDMGITRILTSGFESSAEKGIENLKQLVEEGKLLNITIMPGAGINSSNVSKILDETTCEEIHASARSPMKFSNSIKLSMGGGKDDLNPLMICDIEKAKHLKNAIQNKI